MTILNKVRFAITLLSIFFINACVAPPEKQSKEFVQELNASQQIEIQQEHVEEKQVEILSLDEQQEFALVEGEEIASSLTAGEAKNKEQESSLPIGLPLIEGELTSNSTAQYHVATQKELQQGRKEYDDMAKILKLGLQPTVYFAFNQSELSDESKMVLRPYIAMIIAQQDKNINVILLLEGHTDPVGTSAYNLSLGFRRALSVKKFLVAEGAPENVLEVVSFGEERPVFDETQSDFQRYNRRVELYFNNP